MNPLDRSLHKLLEAASQERPNPSQSPPSSLHAAILDQLRGHRAEDEFTVLIWMFRRAIILAVIVMALSGAWNYLGGADLTALPALGSYATMQLPP
jgi:hypothetical protein